MRLLSFSIEGRSTFGVLDRSGAGVIDLAPRIAGVGSLDELIRQRRLADVHAFLDDPADHLVASITFERTLTWPRKVFCIGVNYGGRSAEYADPTDAPYPSVFIRYPDSLTAHDAPLVRPPESEQLDYEGEIVAVIGTAGRRIPIDRAREHLAGLTLGNEGTIRDWVRHAKFNVTQGKNWQHSGSLGPWMVTMDEVGPFDDLTLMTTVNGEVRQHDSPATMKYSIEALVHYLSTFTELAPGDVIFTGTPTGAGARFDPPLWLAPGDVVEVTVNEIGTLRNTIMDET
ncbi:MAG: fumarylacetoacetate hydrolase family protein [Ilumatobacteraceae bacterium]